MRKRVRFLFRPCEAPRVVSDGDELVIEVPLTMTLREIVAWLEEQKGATA